MTGPKFRHARNCESRWDGPCTCEVEDRYREWAEGAAEDRQHREEWDGDPRG